MADNTKNMTVGKPLPILIQFALPLVAGNVFQLMYTFFDTVIVGKFLGVDALAALGSVEYINWLLFGVIQGITQGFTILMAQDFGNNNIPRLKKAIGNSIVLSALFSVIFIAAGLLGSKPLLLLLRTPKDILPLSTLYIHILFCGVPATFAYNLFAGFLRSLGNSKSPLYAMLVSSVINIGLDLLFVIGFKWGIAGAAIATVIAQIIAAGYCWLFLRKISITHFSGNDLKLEVSLSGKLIKLGLPLAAQNSIIAFGGMIVELVVNSFGPTFIASYVSVTKLYGFLEIAATSFGFSLMTYVGQNYGAGQIDRIRSGTKSGILLSISCSIIISAIMLIFGKNILSLFVPTNGEKLSDYISTSYKYLSLMSIFLSLLYVLWLFRCVIQGLGNTLLPMLSGFAEFIMRTAAALILPCFIGPDGVLYAEILAWLGADFVLVPTFIYYFNKLKKKKINQEIVN